MLSTFVLATRTERGGIHRQKLTVKSPREVMAGAEVMQIYETSKAQACDQLKMAAFYGKKLRNSHSFHSLREILIL